MNINTANSSGSYGEKLEGVLCDVTNCVYNKDKKVCTAKNIKVGPQFAASSADTICATFKPR